MGHKELDPEGVGLYRHTRMTTTETQPPDRGQRPGAAWTAALLALRFRDRMLLVGVPFAWALWAAVVRDPQYACAAGLRYMLREACGWSGLAAWAAGLVTVLGLAVLAKRRHQPVDWLLLTLPALCILFGWKGLVERFPLLVPMCAYVLPGVALLGILRFVAAPAACAFMVRVRQPRHARVFLVVVLTVAYAAMGTVLMLAKGFRSGDEGHYLVQTVSLLEDGDLDLSNNFGDGFRFEATSFEEFHVSPASRRGQAHSHHPFGLSLLLLPGYALAGEWGATAVLILIAVLHGVLLHRLLVTETGHADSAMATTLLFCLSLPLALYAVRGYPEMAGATTYLAAYLLLLSPRPKRTHDYLLAGLCLGIMPWLLIRRCYVPLLVLNAAGIVALLRSRQWRQLTALVIPQLMLMGVLFLVNQWRFAGNDLFAGHEGSALTGGQLPPLSRESMAYGLGWFRGRGLLGIFMDKRFGLLWSNLLLVLLFPAALLTGLRGWKKHWPWLAIVGGVYLMTCGNVFAAWTAGRASHPPRYLVAVLPFLAIPLAHLLAARPRLRGSGGLQVAVGCTVLSLIALLRTAHRFECPYFAYTRMLPALNHLTDAMPWFKSWFHQGADQWLHAWVLTALLLGLSYLTFGRFAHRVSKGVFCLLLLAALMASSLVA